MESEKNNKENGDFPTQEQRQKKTIQIDEFGNYKEPTQEQKQQFEKGIETMSEVFENANFPWCVDGGANITLYTGQQKREHKDLDISIFKEDLPKLKELLQSKGFGIDESKQDHFFIKKLDSSGNFIKTDDLFNAVDLHINDKDKEGNLIISYTGAKFPKEYTEIIKHKLSNGKEVNLSHPALVVYHKLYAYDWNSERGYDIKDLEQIVDKLELKDFEIVRSALMNEFEYRKQRIQLKFEDFWNIISVKLGSKDEASIKEVLFKDKDVEQKMNSDDKMKTITIQYIDIISRYISDKDYNITREDFINKSNEVLDQLENAKQKLEILDNLEKLKINN